MHKKTDEVVDRIYQLYGSGTGHLFGITPNLRGSVMGIVSATLKIIDEEKEE